MSWGAHSTMVEKAWCRSIKQLDTVRKTQMSDGAQLAFSLSHEDGAVPFRCIFPPHQLKLPKNTSWMYLEADILCESRISQADNENEASESSYTLISCAFFLSQTVMVVPSLLMTFSALPKPSSSLCREKQWHLHFPQSRQHTWSSGPASRPQVTPKREWLENQLYFPSTVVDKILLYPQIGSHYIAQTGFKLIILLPRHQPSECCDYKDVSPYSTRNSLVKDETTHSTEGCYRSSDPGSHCLEG